MVHVMNARILATTHQAQLRYEIFIRFRLRYLTHRVGASASPTETVTAALRGVTPDNGAAFPLMWFEVSKRYTSVAERGRTKRERGISAACDRSCSLP